MNEDFKGQSIWNQDWYKSPDEELHDEVEEMFRDEARKHRQEARKTPNIPPGYYEHKSYHHDDEAGEDIYLWELFEVRRLKRRRKKK